MGTLTSQRPELGLAAELELLEMTHARKFTREEFYTMVDAGIFDDDYKVELIDGRIVTEMAPIGGEHGWSVDNLTHLLVGTLLDTDLIVRVQSGVSFPGDRELQPDFAIYRRLPDVRSNPGPSQILLAIEVSDSSLRKDLTGKIYLYAEAGIPTYWVVDVRNRRVNVHTNPVDGLYADLAQFSIEDTIDVCGKQIQVAKIF